MPYVYEMFVNGIKRKTKRTWYKPNIIAEIVEDLPKINNKIDEIKFVVKRIKY